MARAGITFPIRAHVSNVYQIQFPAPVPPASVGGTMMMMGV